MTMTDEALRFLYFTGRAVFTVGATARADVICRWSPRTWSQVISRRRFWRIHSSWELMNQL